MMVPQLTASPPPPPNAKAGSLPGCANADDQSAVSRWGPPCPLGQHRGTRRRNWTWWRSTGEVFVHAGSTYHYGDRKLVLTGTAPVVRVRPDIPLGCSSSARDFGWRVARSDGQVERWLCDP